ncbi:hypothetical protein MRX96_047345 [Rhipicephalus microplus]
MKAKVLLVALVACAILVTRTNACGGEGRSESGRCGGSEGRSEGRSENGQAEARQESETARCGESGRCDG